MMSVMAKISTFNEFNVCARALREGIKLSPQVSHSLEKLKFTEEMCSCSISPEKHSKKQRYHFTWNDERYAKKKQKNFRNGLSLLKPNLDIHFTFLLILKQINIFSLFGERRSRRKKSSTRYKCGCKWRSWIEIHGARLRLLCFFGCSSEGVAHLSLFSFNQWFSIKCIQLKSKKTFDCYCWQISRFWWLIKRSTLNGLCVLFAVIFLPNHKLWMFEQLERTIRENIVIILFHD